MVDGEGTKVGKCQRNRLDKVVLTLEESAVAVGTEGLEYANEEVGPEEVEPLLSLGTVEIADVEIMVEEFAADGIREIGFGTVENRGDIILRGTPPTPLEVDVV